MTARARAEFTSRFGVPVVSDGYGQTECNPITQSPLAEQGPQSGSIGRPVPWLDVRLVDEDDVPVPPEATGEIVVRPHEPMVMFDGYWNNPQATVAVSRDLWHHTGDIARLGDDGYLIYVDRKKDSMRRRGENVSSVELENAISRHPRIAAVATHAVPSPLGEDDIKAWIVLADGAEEFSPEELHRFFAASLPYFAIPRYVEFIEALPVNALGRVLKYKLRERPHAGGWDFEVLQLMVDKEARR
jgi:crotonobetaine/carnitine-CoA ligase